MIRGIICLLACIAIVGCDSFPGPVLRNEFSTEIKVSILYADGTRYSEAWPPCRTVSIGATDVGRFGMRKKAVAVGEITIEVENKVIHRFGKGAIEALLKKANAKQDYLIWVIDKSGIRFTTDRECSLGVGRQ